MERFVDEEEDDDEEEEEEGEERVKRGGRGRGRGSAPPSIDRMLKIVGLLTMLCSYVFATQRFNVADDDSEEEFCQWETFQAECRGEDEVILVTKAFYGRLRTGRCVQRDFGYVNCGVDALDSVGQLCSARRSCSFAVTVLHGNHRCPIDLTGYLIAHYICLKVTPCRQSFCSRSEPIKVPPSGGGGYLSSSRPQGGGGGGGGVLTEGHCGTLNCPWALEVNPGQRINLTLLDFSADLIKTTTTTAVDGKAAAAAAGAGAAAAAAIGSGSGAGSICYRYASVRDGNLTKDLSGCGGRDGQGVRRRNSYVSEGNVVHVTIYTRDATNVHFLIRYQTYGCAAAQLPSNARMKQLGDDVIVECLYSDRIWRLKCNGTTWIGHRPGSQCEPPSTTTHGYERDNDIGSGDSARRTSSLGVVIVVGLGIVIGILIGFSMLLFLTCCIRRSRHGNGGNHPGSPVYWKTRSDLAYHGDVYHCSDHPSTMTPQSPRDYGWTPAAAAADYKPPSPVFPHPTATLLRPPFHHLRSHHHNRLLLVDNCPGGGKRLEDDEGGGGGGGEGGGGGGEGGGGPMDAARTDCSWNTSQDFSDQDHCGGGGGGGGDALKGKAADEAAEYERPPPRTQDGSHHHHHQHHQHHQQQQAHDGGAPVLLCHHPQHQIRQENLPERHHLTVVKGRESN